MKYDQVNDGDWITPIMRGYRMKCCDCGLVHRIDFKVKRHGRGHSVSIRVTRLERATAAARRKKMKLMPL